MFRQVGSDIPNFVMGKSTQLSHQGHMDVEGLSIINHDAQVSGRLCWHEFLVV